MKRVFYFAVFIFLVITSLESCRDREQPDKNPQQKEDKPRRPPLGFNGASTINELALLFKVGKWQRLSTITQIHGEPDTKSDDRSEGLGFIFTREGENQARVNELYRGVPILPKGPLYDIQPHGKLVARIGDKRILVEKKDGDTLTVKVYQFYHENGGYWYFVQTSKIVPWVGYPWPPEKN